MNRPISKAIITFLIKKSLYERLHIDKRNYFYNEFDLWFKTIYNPAFAVSGRCEKQN